MRSLARRIPIRGRGYDVAVQFVRIDLLPNPTCSLSDGDVIAAGSSIRLRVVHRPGHAPVHVAFVDDQDSAVIWGGDLLFRGSVGRTDFPNVSSDDLLVSLCAFV
jgi:glyoxylase-like metal-dependent hydrolase (beta-lactamase superfamily II)